MKHHTTCFCFLSLLVRHFVRFSYQSSRLFPPTGPLSLSLPRALCQPQPMETAYPSNTPGDETDCSAGAGTPLVCTGLRTIPLGNSAHSALLLALQSVQLHTQGCLGSLCRALVLAVERLTHGLLRTCTPSAREGPRPYLRFADV